VDGVQVIKDNRIQVRAKHEEKTVERLCKSKFAREYELGEKIETLSLTGGLATDGRLYVGAFAKGHGGPAAPGDDAKEGEAEEEEEAAAAADDDAAAADASNAATASTDDDGEPTTAAADADAAPLQPCNVAAPAASSSTSAAAATN